MLGKIRIGIIGNLLFKKELLDALKSTTHKHIDFVVRTYEHQDQASELFIELVGQSDAILFSGPVPYFIALEGHVPQLPIEYVKHDEYSLLKAFFRLRECGVSLQKLSTDTLPDAIVLNVYQEIGIKRKNLINMPFSQENIREDVVNFHIENFKAKRTECALTCRSIVKDHLDAIGIPCHHMFWTRRTVLNALDALLNRIMQSRYQGSQIVIGILKVRSPQWHTSVTNVLRTELDLKQYLMRCSEALNVNLLDLGNGLFLFYTTHRALYRITAGLTQAPALPESPDPKTIISCGIGTGLSATVAEEGARQALLLAEQQAKTAYYVMLDGETLIGPLGSGHQKKIRTDDPDIQKLSEQLGVTAPNLARIMEYLEEKPGRTLNAGELAKALGTTSRTANRVLNQLLKGGGAIEVGEQSSGKGQGRPSTIYRIDLTTCLLQEGNGNDPNYD